jgi:hypothetical protein
MSLMEKAIRKLESGIRMFICTIQMIFSRLQSCLLNKEMDFLFKSIFKINLVIIFLLSKLLIRKTKMLLLWFPLAKPQN